MSRSWAVAVLSLVALIHPLPAQTNPTTTIPIGGNTDQYAPTSVQHDIGNIGLVSPGTGWAVVDERLFWTSNNGKDWRHSRQVLRRNILMACSFWTRLRDGLPFRKDNRPK